ncbi:MAG: type II toxin-antitoxin system PemK/MazF family toxin [Sinobacteraceae bacterium]|nr:type II toxin-antitoxin system PemK/MazF family toxin [Nevskiaceae bacterium]
MRRPVLVIQSNPFNESRIATVVVAIITSNIGLADFPGNVRVGKAESGLPKPSVVHVSQLLTIDRGLITEKSKTLPAARLRKIDEGIRLVLAL